MTLNRGARWWPRWWTCALGVALAGCGATLPQDPGSATGAARVAVPARPADALRTPLAQAFEQRQRDKAVAATRQRRLADAALAWEILGVLRPDNADYRERHLQTLRQIDAAVAERLPRAERAAQRGEWEAATQLYLGVLALQPVNETAANGLRDLERERVKRQQLGKSARQALAQARRAAPPEALATPVPVLVPVAPETAPTPAGSNALEHAALLANDDEFDAAVTLLERQLALDRHDAAVQRLLADVQQRRAEALVRQLKARAAPAPAPSGRVAPAAVPPGSAASGRARSEAPARR